VDNLVGQQEVVIKSLGNYLGKIDGIAGSTIMGDGTVVIILDINELFNKMEKRLDA
jgi:two-component system chemotaxis sensor kinase CheA